MPLFPIFFGSHVNDVKVDVVVGVRDPVFGSSIVGVQYGGCGEEGLVLNLPFDTLVQGETVSKELGIQFNTLVQGETVSRELSIQFYTLVQRGTVSKELSIHFNTVVQGGTVSRDLGIQFYTLVQGEQFLES